jgi:hypothetical protein
MRPIESIHKGYDKQRLRLNYLLDNCPIKSLLDIDLANSNYLPCEVRPVESLCRPSFYLAVLFLSSPLWALTYYVDINDSNGLDSRTSTQAQVITTPWKTLTKAQSVATSGDTVILKNGDYGAYTETTTVRTDWVTYKADTGHTDVNFTSIYLGQWNGPFNKYLIFDGIRVIPADVAVCYGVKIINARYVKFNNVTVIGPSSKYVPGDTKAGFYMTNGPNYIDINDCTIDSSSYEPDTSFDIGINAMSPGAFNVTVTDCNIQRGRVGISANGTNWTIANNHIHNTDSDGIFCIDLAHSTIEDNIIEDIGVRVPYHSYSGGCSYVNATKTITANSGNPWSGVPTWVSIPSWRAFVRITPEGGSPTGWYLIDANTTSTLHLITAFGQDYLNISLVELRHTWHSDGIQAYNGSASPPRNVEYLTIRRNIIDHIVHGGVFFNVTLGSRYITMENNFVRSIKSLGIVPAEVMQNAVSFTGTLHLRFINNTIPGEQGSVWSTDNAGKVIIRAQTVPTPDVNSTIDVFANNIIDMLDFYWDNGEVNDINYENYNIINKVWAHMNTYTRGSNDIYLNGNVSSFKVLFAGYDNNDLSLSSDSAAINSGNSTYGGATDVLGHIRAGITDRGAFEYGGGTDPPNHSPVLGEIGNKSVNENALLTFTVHATDEDADPCTYSVAGLPVGATINSSTGVFSWRPTYSQGGVYNNVIFTAGDGSNQDTETVVVTVNNKPQGFIGR